MAQRWCSEEVETRRSAWSQIWGQALRNMPERKGYKGLPRMGEYSALARCLGMKLYSTRADGSKGHFVAHNHIYTAMVRGYGPRDKKRRQRLMRIAGTYGKVYAHYLLRDLRHRYVWDE